MSSIPQTPPLEVETGPKPTASVIWLHGLGADGHDFEPIVPELGLARDPAIRFVFPHAPHRPVTINNGYVMRAWYDIAVTEFGRQEDAAGIRESEQILLGLIQRERDRGVTADRIVLAGFSQGGAIALHTGLRAPQRLGGILALSCYLPLTDTLEAEAHPANVDVPIFMAHGTDDPVIAVELGESSADWLKRRGARIEWRTYPMGHSVHPREISDIASWLKLVLGAT
jgi:phospholipase/carboxylesterase